MIKVRKAVITAAGWGTRFLPVTRSQPKEMLPLISKPLIHYIVEEARNSGIEQVIFVTAMGKRAIEDYFDRSLELEEYLRRKGEDRLLEEMQELSYLIDVCYIRQKEQLGLGHAILTAEDVVGDEPFAVLLPDDIIDSETPALRQMLEIYEKYGGSVIAVEKIEARDTVKYGVIKAEAVAPRVYRVLGLVEKPEPAQAPSDMGIVGRYILSPQVFDMLKDTPPGRGGEIQITDALQRLVQEQEILACEFEGVRYDTGTPLGWLKATVDFAVRHPDFGQELQQYLRRRLQ